MTDSETRLQTCISFIGDGPNDQPWKIDTRLEHLSDMWHERAATFEHACMPVPVVVTCGGRRTLLNPAAIAFAYEEQIDA